MNRGTDRHPSSPAPPPPRLSLHGPPPKQSVRLRRQSLLNGGASVTDALTAEENVYCIACYVGPMGGLPSVLVVATVITVPPYESRPYSSCFRVHEGLRRIEIITAALSTLLLGLYFYCVGRCCQRSMDLFIFSVQPSLRTMFCII